MGKKRIKNNKKNRQNNSLKDVLSISLFNKNRICIECEKLFKVSSSSIKKNESWENFLEMSRILDTIKTLENGTSDLLDNTERELATEEFIAWLRKNGADINNVSIHQFPGFGLGLRANVDLNENECILKIPRNLIFNVYTSAAELKDIEDDILIQHMPHVALAIALLIEKHKNNSLWEPYINILPKKYCTVLYMSADNMTEFKDSPTFELALKQCRNIARQYSYFKRMFSKCENSVSKILENFFTYEEYRWAVSTIMTRQNVIPDEKKSVMINSLIPMWDMCNHSNGKITTNFNEISNYCECYAMKDVKAKDQIFICYGSRTNAQFFIHSGFVYPDNENDTYELRLGISTLDPLKNEKMDLLSKVGLPIANSFLLKPQPKLLSGPLLGYLRIFTMNKNILDSWLKSDTKEDIIKKDFSPNDAVDKNVLNFIITRVKLLLTKYLNIDEAKIDLLEATESCQKMILQLKLSEKNVLVHILGLLENYL